MRERNGLFRDARISSVLETLTRLASGDLKSRIPLTDKDDEIEAIIVGINMLAEEIEERSTQVSGATERLRSLASQLADAEEISRQHLARELHDRVGQSLSVLGMNLQRLRNILPENTTVGVIECLDNAVSLLEEIARSIRHLMSELRPALLDDLGLLPALQWYAGEFQKQTGIEVEWGKVEATHRLPAKTEIALFRIVQEALANVAKHAQTDSVRLSVIRDRKRLRISVVDAGVGFHGSDNLEKGTKETWGLDIMRERAQAVGAVLRVESAPGKGTRVVVELEP